MRSMNTSLFTAGNFGFKRDLTNQGERAMALVLDLVQAVPWAPKRRARPTQRPPQLQRIDPADQRRRACRWRLLSDAAFAAVGVAGNDIAAADMGVTVRYVIDRLCAAAGPASADSCTVASATAPRRKRGQPARRSHRCSSSTA